MRNKKNFAGCIIVAMLANGCNLGHTTNGTAPNNINNTSNLHTLEEETESRNPRGTNSQQTHLYVHNMTNRDIMVTAETENNVGWDGSARPNNNMNNRIIKSGETIHEKEEINTHAKSSKFDLCININNEKTCTGWIDQKPSNYTNNLAFFKIPQKDNTKEKYSFLQYQHDTDTLIILVPNIDTANWMKNMPDSSLLSNMVIPGTHDSATFNAKEEDSWLAFGIKHFTKTQRDSQDFTQQLNDGIRFFDLRVKDVGGKWTFVHGSHDMAYTFDRFAEASNDWLEKHPTETLLISIKRDDGNDKDFELKFESILLYYANKYPNLFILDPQITRLKEARGKIVVMTRFKSKYGIDISKWPDNTIFTAKIASIDNISYSVQDSYDTTNINCDYYSDGRSTVKSCDNPAKVKSQKFFGLTQQANSIDRNDNDWFINFFSSSHSGCLYRPNKCADDNKEFIYKGIQEVKNHNENGFLNGQIVPMDFYSDGMVNYLIAANQDYLVKTRLRTQGNNSNDQLPIHTFKVSAIYPSYLKGIGRVGVIYSTGLPLGQFIDNPKMLKINAKEEPIALNKQIINSEFLFDPTTTYEVKVYLVLGGGASCKNLTDDKECDKDPVEFTYTCTTTKLCTATDMRKQIIIDNHKLDVDIKNMTNETNQHVEIEAN